MSVKQNLHNNSCRQVLLVLFVFILGFVSIIATIDDYGLTWDEPYYIVHSERISEWLGKLIKFDDPFSDEAFQKYWNYDRHHNCHPPFYKLSGILFKKLIGRFLYDNIVYQYRVSTAFWASVFLVVLALYFLRTYENYLIAILASLTFLLVPRFFAHMHFIATDIVLTSLSFITLYIFYYQPVRSKRILFSSIFAGALLATKFTGLLLFPIVLSFLFVSRNKRQFFVDYLAFTVLSCIFFIIFNPHAWFGIGRELLFYFQSFFERESVVPVPTLYFGKVYDFRLPWHHPFVIFAIVLPILVVGFVIPGMVHNLKNARQTTSFFEIAPFILLFAAFVLPRTPKHDGVRLFSMAWPFIIILFIRGAFVSSQYFTNLIARIATGLGVVTTHLDKLPIVLMVILVTANMVFSLSRICAYHPYELSYYNELIGGPEGAAEEGFTISYWCEALNKDTLKKVSSFFGNRRIKVYSYPNKDILNWNRYFGLFDGAVNSVDTIEESNYVLVLNRTLSRDLYEYVRRNMEQSFLELEDNTLVIVVLKNDTRHGTS